MNTETIAFNPHSGRYEIHTCSCLVPYDHLSNGICGRQGCGGRIPPATYVEQRAANFKGQEGADLGGERERARSIRLPPRRDWNAYWAGAPTVEPWPPEGEWDAWKTPGHPTFTVGWMVNVGAEGFQRVATVETRQAAEALVALLKVFGAVPGR